MELVGLLQEGPGRVEGFDTMQNFEVYDKTGVPPAYGIPLLESEAGVRISEVHEDKCTFYSAAYNSSLAAYLIGAYEYSYYGCTEGFTLQTGWDIIWQNPDFYKPLGKPKMNATFNNDTQIYYREYSKGVKVWLDFEWQYPCIQWSDGSITGTTKDCNKYKLL